MMAMSFIEEHGKYVRRIIEDRSPAGMAGYYISLVLGFLTIILVIYVYGFM